MRERNELLGPASKEGRVAELRGYDRTKRERIAGAMMDAIAGDKRPTSLQRKLVGGIMGSTGLGSTGLGLVDISPLAPVLASDEFQHAVRNEDWLSALLALLGLTSAAGRAGRSIVGDVRALGQNPFKGRTPEQIDAMFRDRGFSVRGPNPKRGIGDYLNPNTERPYHLDAEHLPPKPPHVGVGRPRRFRNKGLTEAREYPL